MSPSFITLRGIPAESGMRIVAFIPATTKDPPLKLPSRSARKVRLPPGRTALILPPMTTGCDYVLFAPTDYAGLPRRIAAMLVDLVIVIAAVSGISSAVAARVVPPDVWKITHRAERQRKMNDAMRPVQLPTSLGCLGFAMAYHVLGRTLRDGTIGYRISGVRLVDAAGRTPPLRVLFKRFLMAVPFTLFLGASYFSVGKSPRRQSTHDQWSGTWVVRKAAVPIGPAKPAYQTKLLGTMLFTWLDLEPADAAPADNAQPLSATAS